MLRPGRLWRPLVSQLKLATQLHYAGNRPSAIWQATYYTPPPQRWRGHFVVLFHDLMEERYPDLFSEPRHDELRRLKQVCAHSADIVICNSRTTQRDVCEHYGLPESKTRMITLAASEVFRPLAETKSPRRFKNLGVPFILYVGNRSQYKNFDRLLQAFAAWPRRKEIDLVVVGHKWTGEEMTRLSQLVIVDSVLLREGVDDTTLCALYNQAAAFVYPSLYEGFGIPLLEAIACECPVVASAIPSTQEVADGYPYFFTAEDVVHLQQTLDEAVTTGKDTVRLTAARQRASQFTWAATAQQVLDIYRELN